MLDKGQISEIKTIRRARGKMTGSLLYRHFMVILPGVTHDRRILLHNYIKLSQTALHLRC